MAPIKRKRKWKTTWRDRNKAPEELKIKRGLPAEHTVLCSDTSAMMRARTQLYYRFSWYYPSVCGINKISDKSFHKSNCFKNRYLFATRLIIVIVFNNNLNLCSWNTKFCKRQFIVLYAYRNRGHRIWIQKLTSFPRVNINKILRYPVTVYIY